MKNESIHDSIMSVFNLDGLHIDSTTEAKEEFMCAKGHFTLFRKMNYKYTYNIITIYYKQSQIYSIYDKTYSKFIKNTQLSVNIYENKFLLLTARYIYHYDGINLTYILRNNVYYAHLTFHYVYCVTNNQVTIYNDSLVELDSFAYHDDKVLFYDYYILHIANNVMILRNILTGYIKDFKYINGILEFKVDEDLRNVKLQLYYSDKQIILKM